MRLQLFLAFAAVFFVSVLAFGLFGVDAVGQSPNYPPVSESLNQSSLEVQKLQAEISHLKSMVVEFETTRKEAGAPVESRDTRFDSLQARLDKIDSRIESFAKHDDVKSSDQADSSPSSSENEVMEVVRILEEAKAEMAIRQREVSSRYGEMTKGEYGKHNYTVNSAEVLLKLEAGQKEEFYEILQERDSKEKMLVQEKKDALALFKLPDEYVRKKKELDDQYYKEYYKLNKDYKKNKDEIQALYAWYIEESKKYDFSDEDKKAKAKIQADFVTKKYDLNNYVFEKLEKILNTEQKRLNSLAPIRNYLHFN